MIPYLSQHTQLKDFIKEGTEKLSALYPKEEARSMIMFYCADIFGFPSYQHITEPKTEVPPELLEQALDDLRRLAESEPLQYVLGYTEKEIALYEGVSVQTVNNSLRIAKSKIHDVFVECGVVA